MKKLLTVSLCSLFLFSAVNVLAQKKETRLEKKEQREDRRKAEEVKFAQQNVASIESLNFTFYPTTVEPEFGITNDLSGMNNPYFTVDKTVLYMSLPYIGRFYANPMSPESSPITLTSNKFLYSVSSTDGVNIQVTIVPTDLVSVFNQDIKFVLYMNKKTGYARLVMTADNRQEMTYTGSFS